MGRIVQSVAMSYVRGCLVGGVVTIYVFAIFIGFFLLPLGRMHRTPGSDPKEIFLPIGIGAFFLMVLPAILAYFGARARNTAFDRMFGSLGLAGFPYAVQYRRYEGTYGGRRFQGFFSRGPRFALEADVAVRTRFGITAGSGDTRLLAALAGKPPIRFAVPAFRCGNVAVCLQPARGYNIETLTVAPTEDASLSRMTIVSVGSDDVIEQITKQLNKLVEVLKVVELEPSSSVQTCQ